MYRHSIFAILIGILILDSLGAESLIRFEKQILNEEFYAEGANFGDVNGDGAMDIVYGPFWYAGPDFKSRHTLYEPKAFNINGYSDNFFSYVEDLTGDGAADVLVLGFPGKEARLYVNPGKGVKEVKTWPMHHVADIVDNESPEFVDVDGDGSKEILCSREGRFGYYKATKGRETEAWQWVPVTTAVGVQRFTHGLGLGDVDGDGKLDLLETQRWWKAPSEGTGEWTPHRFQIGGSGGAQMFAYDFNGDGKNDILTSLNAHQFGVTWFENQLGAKDSAQWTPHLIVGKEPWENPYGVSFSQPHALSLADIDGDGVKDFVTGKRYWAHNGKDPNEQAPKVLYWFQTQRTKAGGVEFIPHLIDSDTGVGTQLVTGDINGDGLIDVLVGNKHGLRVLMQKREEVNASRFAQFQPKKIYGEESIRASAYQAGQKVEDSVKNMIVPPGFQVESIASEPGLVQPIAFTWDEKGRIWVIEGNTYPKRAPEGEGKDRILILEDKDGDGKFETRKVFFEGLNLASGIEVGYGGVWVGSAPYFYFISDKNGDDIPDAAPQVLLDGWGYQDTHETLNSFIWGPDGWLYGCHGVFTHSKVGKPGTPEEKRIPLNAAVWRYHPTQHVFEVFAEGTSNPWGLDFNAQGDFFTTACVIPHLYHIVPGGRYQRQAGQHFNPYTYDDIKTIAKFRHFAGKLTENTHWGARLGQSNLAVKVDTDAAGGGHAHCGLAIYQADQFPAMYRGTLLFGNLHGHRLVQNGVENHGSGYEGFRRSDFLKSHDFWFIPVTQKVGPDGSLYISDWYDKQICHQNDPLVWDRSNGRMYRVSYDQAQAWKGDLRQQSLDELLDSALHAKNEWFSRMARRILAERVQEEKLKLSEVLEHRLIAEAKDSVKAHFLKLTLTGLKTETLPQGIDLGSKDEVVRVFSVRHLWNRLTLKPEKLEAELLAQLETLAANEKSPGVRRELASLTQKLDLGQRVGILRSLVKQKSDANDHNIPLLAWYGLEPVIGESPNLGAEFIALTEWTQLKGFIARRMAASEEGRMALLSELSKIKSSELRDEMLGVLLKELKVASKIAIPSQWSSLYEEIKKGEKSPQVLEKLEILSAYFGGEEAQATWLQKLKNKGEALEVRKDALGLLVAVRYQPLSAAIAGLLRENDEPLISDLIRALQAFSDQSTPKLLVDLYSKLSTEQKLDAITVLTSTDGGAVALLEAIKKKAISDSVLSPFITRQLQASKNEPLQLLLKEIKGSRNVQKPQFAEQRQKWKAILTPEKLKKADLAKGKILFQGSCAACHQLNGEGVYVGPDLTGSNRGNLDYLLENVLDPNSMIGRDYQLNVFQTKDQRVLSGMVKSESAESWTLILPGGAQSTVKRDEVASREISQLSMMPEGLFDALGEENVVHLVAYLQSGAVQQGEAAKPLEAEELSPKVNHGQIQAQPMGGFKLGQWSGQQQLWWTGGRVGDQLTLQLEVPEEGKYRLAGVFTYAHDYAVVEFFLDGKEIHEPMDFYDSSVQVSSEIELGEFVLTKGAHELSIRISGKNAKATPALMVGVDYLSLMPLTKP